MTIPSLILRAELLYPESIAVIDSSRSISYRSFATMVRSMAASLRSAGIRVGDRVAVLDYNTPEFLAAYFAVPWIGAIMVPLNVKLSDAELREILRDSGAVLVLVGSQLDTSPDTLGGLPRVAIKQLQAGGYSELEPHRNAVDAVAQLYYTSGTTGSAKGVMLTHRNVITHALGAVAELSLNETDRWAHIAPMFHLADAWATFAITLVGGTHVMLPRFTANAALELIEEHRVTVTNLVPTMLNLMIRDERIESIDLSSMRLVLSGGAPIAPQVVCEIIQRFGCEYVQTYGMTETSPYLTLSTLSGGMRAWSEEEQLRMRCKTGRPFVTAELKVVDDAGNEVPPDGQTVGEILARGETVTPGYWKKPDETARAFTADGYLRTGDLATIDEYGYLNIVDRKKDMILTGGENVYSTEVENVLYDHPGVLEAAAFGVDDEIFGEVVAVVVVPRAGVTIELQELRLHCQERLAAYKVPRKLLLLDSLPRTGSGKILKRALKDRYSLAVNQ